MATVVSINHFPAITIAMAEALSLLVETTAFNIATTAREFAPVDTGFLSKSIYVATWDKSTYTVDEIEPPGDSYLFPEVDIPSDRFTAYVAVGASYGVFLEYGTRFMPAQPYFHIAVELEKALFDAELGAIDARLQGIFG